MMNVYKRSFIVASLLVGVSASATLTNEKITLNGDMSMVYNELPKSAKNIREVFTNSVFYGRLRTNTFYWDWDTEIANKQEDNKAIGIGASMLYKSAPLQGVSATLGMYTSQVPMMYRTDSSDLGLMKAGKDTLSRSDTSLSGDYGMSVVGQAYFQYDIAKTKIFAGRQLVETVFTKSNDTKMIPNTFDGISLESKDLAQTTIQLAYLAKQKLRDHTTSHDVIAFNGWSENDDSAINKNLTAARVGTNNSLSIVSVTNTSVENLKANVSFAMVPSIVSNLTLEAHYKIPLVGKWSVAPGFRYMKQIDNLNSNDNVASLKEDKDNTGTIGYNNKTSLNSSLLALRVDVKNGPFLGRLGYSKIADEADIIAPWRGFPTGGFTRAMAQYNWFANTKTYMARVGYDFSKANLIPGFSLMGRYVIQDFDDTKAGVQADSTVIHIDARQNVCKYLEAKLRVGIVNADVGNTGKTDVSYNEYRVELNYFF